MGVFPILSTGMFIYYFKQNQIKYFLWTNFTKNIVQKIVNIDDTKVFHPLHFLKT